LYTDFKNTISTLLENNGYTRSPYLFSVKKLPNSIIDRSYSIELKNIIIEEIYRDGFYSGGVGAEINIIYRVDEFTNENYDIIANAFEDLTILMLNAIIDGEINGMFSDSPSLDWDGKDNNHLIGNFKINFTKGIL